MSDWWNPQIWFLGEIHQKAKGRGVAVQMDIVLRENQGGAQHFHPSSHSSGGILAE